jgi:hypothetical protein
MSAMRTTVRRLGIVTTFEAIKKVQSCRFKVSSLKAGSGTLNLQL